MKPYLYQMDKAKQAFKLIKDLGYVYIAGKPRSGKTLTAILVAEMSTKINSVLVLTKKNAIPGWTKFIEDKELNLKHKYYVTNYEQVGSIKGGMYYLKLQPKDYQLVIIDESHNLGKVGKPSNRYRLIRKLCYDMPHIHLSGTAIVESANSIYYQMSISKFNPFKFSTFYNFFRVYGKPYYIKAMGRDILQYDKYRPELLNEIDDFTIYLTQEEAGITVKSEDKIHYIELNDDTKKLYNTLQKNCIADIWEGILSNDSRSEDGYGFTDGIDKELVCDSTMKLRTSLHMLESGVCKIGEKYINLGNKEKIDYIKATFGDNEDMGIMCHFIGERKLLSREFKNAKIYSSNADAEGVDLSHLKHFIIFSSDYSGSKFIQRRDRILNTNGSNTTTVNHLLVKGAISDQVYKRVSKKKDFNNSTYDRTSL